MKKMWIKKESLYHKPFYKQKLKMTMLGVLLMGILFFAYQVFSLNQLPLSGTSHINNNDNTVSGGGSNINSGAPSIVIAPGDAALLRQGRGVRELDLARYQPNIDRTFRCLRSGELFNASKLNDDYCDCADGSDEPATSACPNGRLYCAHRARHPRAGVAGQRHIPSSRINDGICDCCDGSDEWLPQRNIGPAKCVHRCG